MTAPVHFKLFVIATALCITTQQTWAQDQNNRKTATSESMDTKVLSGSQATDVFMIPPAPFMHHDAEELSILRDENSKEITQTSAHRLQQTDEAAHTTYIITDEDISKHGWRTLAEILRHVPGIHTLTSESQFQTVAIRGMAGIDTNNSRILWLIDDVPINTLHNSGIWLDDTFAVDFIRRIEVVVGPAGSTYGAGAYQGVVHIITKNAEDLNKYGEYRVAIQDHQTFKASAAYGYKADSGFSILGHATFGTTQGPGLVADAAYNNYAMKEASASVSGNRQPTAYRSNKIENSSQKIWYDLDLKLNYKDLSFNVGFKDIYAHADGSEVHNYLSTDQIRTKDEVTASNEQNMVVDKTVSLNAPYQFNRRSLTTSLAYHHAFRDLVDLSALASYRFSQFEHQNYHGLIETDEKNQSDPRYFNYDITEHQVHLNIQTDWNLFNTNTLTVGVSMDYNYLSDDMLDKTLTSSYLSPTGMSLGYLTPSVYINDEQRLWHNRIILSAGYRFDAWQATEDLSADSSAHFSFIGKWHPIFTTRLSYSYATYEPSWQHRYLLTKDAVGELSIKQENIHNAELALIFDPLDNLHIQINGFGSFFNHLSGIYPFNLPKYISTYIQSGSNYIVGAEFLIDADIAQAWHLAASYNFLYSRLKEFSTWNKILATPDETNPYPPNSFINSWLRFRYNAIPEDTRHQIKLSATYTNDMIRSGVAFFILAGTPTTNSQYTWRSAPYAISAYAILQPHISIALPANLGLMAQGSYAFSRGMTESPTYRYYYEREGVPVNRYSVMLSLLYPFKKSE